MNKPLTKSQQSTRAMLIAAGMAGIPALGDFAKGYSLLSARALTKMGLARIDLRPRVVVSAYTGNKSTINDAFYVSTEV